MATILIISMSDLHCDPRVRRQIMILKDMYQVTACGLTNPRVDGIDFIPLQQAGKGLLGKGLSVIFLKTRQFESVYWSKTWVRRALADLQGHTFDLILANDLNTLPLAVNLAEAMGAKVFFDAHEYAPQEYDDKWFFRFFFRNYSHYLCSRYIPQVDAMVTVSKAIAEEYSRVYGVSCGVLTNAPFYEDQEPSLVNDQHIRMVHHGLAHSSRHLENMIYLMDLLDERFTLDLILTGNDTRYFRGLQRVAQNQPRVRFRDPVPMPEISRTLREYDIGIYLLPSNTLNARLALPNKFFEFIQGRLCVAIWPSPEMVRVIREYNCGVVAGDFTLPAMASELDRLTAEGIWHFKQQAHKAAQILSADSNRQILLDLVENIVR